MLIKICKQCGKPFPTKDNRRVYCSKHCRYLATKRYDRVYGQICWQCENTIRVNEQGELNCSWMRDNIPVDGWIAKSTIIQEDNENVSSYRIVSCPNFQQERMKGRCK